MKTKVLTVRQPWATAILELGKDIENRTWYTHHRGELLIHSSKTKLKDDELEALNETYYVPEFLWWNDPFDAHPFYFLKTADCYGCIIGSVQLIDVVINHPSRWAMAEHYHWVLAEPKVFPNPIPIKGRLGLWEYDQMPLFNCK